MTTRDPVWLHDLAGDQVGAVRQDLTELWRDDRLDQSDRLGFSLPADHPKADLIVADVEVRYRDTRFRIDEVEDIRDGAATYRKATAEALWVELGDTDVPGSTVLDTNPAAGLAAILDGSRWTLGDRTTLGGGTYSIEETDRSRLALLRIWAKVTGLNLIFDTIRLTVDLVETRGRDLGLAYRYRRNVTGHRRRRRAPEATVLLPYGADELTIAGVNSGNPEVSDFTYYTDRGLTLTQAKTLKTRRRVWVDTSFVREDNLYDSALVRLAELSAERLEYQLDVIDASDITGNDETVAAGDRVRVADPDFDVDVRATVVRRYTDHLDPTNNAVELDTLPDPLGLDTVVGRTQTGEAWEQFVGRIAGTYQVRNDGDYTVARIPLRFRTGGRMNVHANVKAAGVGSAGIAYVTVYDADTGLDLHRSADIPYTDGGNIILPVSFAAEDLDGIVNLGLRVTTLATGGPAASRGLNIDEDPETVASFYVMAQGAVKETPTVPSSITYNYTGTVQTFTVPDNIEEVTIETVGSAGGGGDPGDKGARGNGAGVAATFPVIPGTTYNVYVGGRPWPNGGDGAQANGTGSAGGGATYLIDEAADLGVGIVTGALIVAAGGGGGGDDDFFAPGGNGGNGGYLAGGDGTGGNPGGGATQNAPGAAGGGETGDTDGRGFGGDGTTGGGVVAEGGGGGGGWYGGGGAGLGSNDGGGGGGSGYIDPTGTDLLIDDGGNSGLGYAIVSWEAELENI